MRCLLSNLKTHGFLPHVAVTDGSNLYPAELAVVRHDARHQLCVLNVLKDINGHVFDALRRRHAGTGGRKRRRGRSSRIRKPSRASRGPTRKAQAHFVWKNRHRIATRPEDWDGRPQWRLGRMFEYLPALRGLRAFVLQVYRLFDPQQSPYQAVCRRSATFATRRTLTWPRRGPC